MSIVSSHKFAHLLLKDSATDANQYAAGALKYVAYQLLEKPDRLITAEELSTLPRVGKGIMRRFEGVQLYKVPGFVGMYTREQIRALSATTNIQKIGLEHYEDLNKQIPREQAHEIALRMISILGLRKFEIVGSFRRGKTILGDIDILTTGPVDMRKINDAIVLSAGEKKISFIWSQPARQVDIFIATAAEWVPMLLYTTGSKEHNKMIRGLCKNKGWKLTQYGLSVVASGEIIPLENETTIYQLLGLKYVRPVDR
jgi:DNA polymerase/3'-5' exonuclease PolX